MKNQASHFKGQFLFLLGLTIPAALIGSINPAQAKPLSSTTTTTNPKPFIDSTSRYDSLKGLHTKPIGKTYLDKDASDDKKKESKDGKEQSEVGAHGQEVINPATFKQIRYKGGNIHSQLPAQLFTSQQPII
jgi:hypothetical protein